MSSFHNQNDFKKSKKKYSGDRKYKIYPRLQDGTFYIYYYDLKFGATFKSLDDIKKYLERY